MTTDNLDPFAFSRQDEDATKVLSLFRLWLAECRVCDELRKRHGDAESDDLTRSIDRLTGLEDQIEDLQGCAVGLAVKVFFDLKQEACAWAPLSHQIRVDKREFSRKWFASVLRDAASIVPEIADCAESIIHDDADLIDAEMTLAWVHVVWPPRHHESDSEWARHVKSEWQNALDCIANTAAKTPRGEAIKAKYAGVTVPA